MRTEHVPTPEAALSPDPLMGRDSVNSGLDETMASWLRCQDQYKLDQCSKNVPDMLTAGELHCVLEQAEGIVVHSREELDSLSAIVRPLGYATLIANLNGVITHARAGRRCSAVQFKWDARRRHLVGRERRHERYRHLPLYAATAHDKLQAALSNATQNVQLFRRAHFRLARPCIHGVVPGGLRQ